MITGADVLAKRKEMKLSRADFGQLCGLTASKIWRIETKDEFKPGEIATLNDAFKFIIKIEPGKLSPLPDFFSDDLTFNITPDTTDFPAMTVKKGGLKWPVPASDAWAAPTDIVGQKMTFEFTDVDLKTAEILLGETIDVGPVTVAPTFDYDTTRYISHSEIVTFQDCKRKWWLSWHRGLRPATESPVGALAMGTRVHKALEFHYPVNPAFAVDPRDMIENLIVKDWTVLSDHYTAQGEVIPPEVKKKFETEAKMQRVMIEGYLAWAEEEGTDALYETIQPEKFVESTNHSSWFDGRELHLVGRIDRLVKRLSDGAILFEDFKTAASIPALVKMLPINTQMKHYLMLLNNTTDWKEFGGHIAGALYTILRKSMQTVTATPPFYARVEVHHNIIEQANYSTVVKGIIDEIEQVEKLLDVSIGTHQEIVPPRPSNDCSWKCPFFQACPMFDDGSAVESMLENHFVSGKALDYYSPMKKETD
jgi:hypothetical protein